MNRPTVLHCVSEWGVPSQQYVRDLVTTTSATRAVVAAQRTLTNDRTGVRVWRKPAVLRHGGRRAELVWLGAVSAAARASLLHVHLGYWAGTVGRVAALRRLPWVLSLHGHDLLVRARTLKDPEPWKAADLVIVPSSFLADKAAEFGIDAERVRVIPSGIDLARIDFAARQPDADGSVTILFVGRFVEKKGAVDAAAAVATVARDRPHVHALFVGYGEQSAEVTAALGPLGARVRVVDGSRPGAVAAALARAHLLVSPSRTAADGDAETLSVVNLEAQAAGLPVVTTRHGGIPDAVTDASAVLVDEGDQGGLIKALGELVDDPDRWPAMGAAGRQHVEERFELGARTAEVEAHYLAIIERRPLPPSGRGTG